MKLNIRKTFVTLAVAFVVLLALSLPAFAQDTCTPSETKAEKAQPENGFSGGVYAYVLGQGIDTSQPQSGIYVYAVDQSTSETFRSITDSDGIFGRSGTGGFTQFGFVNEGQPNWTDANGGEVRGNNLKQCHYYDIIVGTGFFTPNPYTAFPGGYWGGVYKIWFDSFGI